MARDVLPKFKEKVIVSVTWSPYLYPERVGLAIVTLGNMGKLNGGLDAALTILRNADFPDVAQAIQDQMVEANRQVVQWRRYVMWGKGLPNIPRARVGKALICLKKRGIIEETLEQTAARIIQYNFPAVANALSEQLKEHPDGC